MGEKRRRGARCEDGNGNVEKKLKQRKSRDGGQNTDSDFITQNDYVILGDLMFVRPYVFEFKCFFKPRWRNCKIFDVFVDEFRHVGREYWKTEFSDGRVLSNGKPISEETMWTDGIEVVHIVHRHESAVLSTRIEIAKDEDGYVVVSKPPSMPVHPCGTYRRNCLQFVLQAFHGYNKLLCVHRLDKETSGLVILAKTSKYAAMFSDEIKMHRFQKTYLAEVHGMFPQNITECTLAIHWDKRAMRAFIRKDGLDAKTSFKVVSRDALRNTTVIECKPFTGRTHQIRIHLAHLGYPIVNDPMYGCQPQLLQCDNTMDHYVLGEQRDLSTITLNHPEFQENPKDTLRPLKHLSKWSQHVQQGQRLTSAEEGQLLKCSNCPQVTNVKNVGIETMFIHLHALKYESDKWSFQVAAPPWMREGEFNNSDNVLNRENTQWRFCNIS